MTRTCRTWSAILVAAQTEATTVLVIGVPGKNQPVPRYWGADRVPCLLIGRSGFFYPLDLFTHRLIRGCPRQLSFGFRHDVPRFVGAPQRPLVPLSTATGHFRPTRSLSSSSRSSASNSSSRASACALRTSGSRSAFNRRRSGRPLPNLDQRLRERPRRACEAAGGCTERRPAVDQPGQERRYTIATGNCLASGHGRAALLSTVDRWLAPRPDGVRPVRPLPVPPITPKAITHHPDHFSASTDGEFVPGSAVEHPVGFLFAEADHAVGAVGRVRRPVRAPLFEQERDTGGAALIAQGPRPLRPHRSRTPAGLPADNHPIRPVSSRHQRRIRRTAPLITARILVQGPQTLGEVDRAEQRLTGQKPDGRRCSE